MFQLNVFPFLKKGIYQKFFPIKKKYKFPFFVRYFTL